LKLGKFLPVGLPSVGIKFPDSPVICGLDFFLGFDTSGLAICALSWWAAFYVPLVEFLELVLFFLGKSPVS
jgi:hypothetical protein